MHWFLYLYAETQPVSNHVIIIIVSKFGEHLKTQRGLGAILGLKIYSWFYK